MTTTQYKLGQKVRIKVVPGVTPASFKVKPPFEAEIVAVELPKADAPEKSRKVLIRADNTIDAGYAYFLTAKEWEVVNGAVIDSNVLYVTASCFEMIDATGQEEPRFKLEQQVVYQGRVCRVLGYNLSTGNYVLESENGEKLTHAIIKTTNAFIGYLVPGADKQTNIKCAVVSEKDLLKENPLNHVSNQFPSYQVEESIAHFMNTESKPKFVDTLKEDGKDAIYRVAARQMSKAVQNAIINMLAAQGTKKAKLNSIKEFLSSEVGEAFIKSLIGYALTYIPHINEDPRAKRLAAEFRVDSMAQVGNLAVEHLLPLVANVFATLPAYEAEPVQKPEVKKISSEILSTLTTPEVETVTLTQTQTQTR